MVSDTHASRTRSSSGQNGAQAGFRAMVALGCALAVCWALPALADATTYYVSPGGSDGNPGTSTTSPWQTVGRVNAATLAPGDTVLFQGNGTYAGAALAPTASGSATAPITFGAYGGGSPTIAQGITLGGPSHLTFRGLRLTSNISGSGSNLSVLNSTLVLPSGNALTGINASGTGWAISGNTVTGAGSSGISLTGSGYTVQNNSILESGGDQAITSPRNGITVHASGTKITGNVIQDFWSNGILATSHTTTITGNYIANRSGYSTATTDGILFQEDDTTAGKSTWTTNTIAGTTGSDIALTAGTSTLKERFVISRNSLLQFSGAYLTTGAAGTGCQCDPTQNPELGISSGTTYYVATGGSDANSGTSPLSPWKTIGEANNPGANHPGLSLQPGDIVLFHGAQKFTDATLDAHSGSTSGGVEKPVVLGSYGPGQATISPASAGEGVWFAGIHDAVVQGLTIDGSTSAQPDGGVYSHDGANDCSDQVCSYNVVINGNTIRHWFEGVRAGPADHDWTVEFNEIDHTDDNGIFFDRSGTGPYFGSVRMNALYNNISDTGQHPPDHPHAIYDDSTSSRVIGNHIARFGDGNIPSSGISIRFTRSIVEDNTIDGGDIPMGNGIDLYDYDSGAGCTTASPCPALWAYNKIMNVAGNGIYVDYHYGPDVCGTQCPPQAFTIADNTVINNDNPSGSEFPQISMIDFEYPSGSLTLANNIATGTAGYDLGIEDDHSPCPVGGAVKVSESYNDFSNSSPDQWQYCSSHYSTLAAYQQATGLGSHDLNVAPQVNPTTFALAAGSPAINAGTTNVPGAPAYQPTCAGADFEYCGAAPDLGAVEFTGAGARVAARTAAAHRRRSH